MPKHEQPGILFRFALQAALSDLSVAEDRVSELERALDLVRRSEKDAKETAAAAERRLAEEARKRTPAYLPEDVETWRGSHAAMSEILRVCERADPKAGKKLATSGDLVQHVAGLAHGALAAQARTVSAQRAQLLLADAVEGLRLAVGAPLSDEDRGKLAGYLRNIEHAVAPPRRKGGKRR